MFRHLSNLNVRAVMMTLVAACAFAQKPVAPDSELQTTPASTPKSPTSAASDGKINPTPAIPGLRSETFSVPPGRYFPEGTFLVRRTGTVRILKTGEAVFIPDMPSPRDARRRGERPMVLLPCQTLAALQSSVATSPNPNETRVEVSGQLFVYRERQQLLPTIFTIVRSAPTTTEPAAMPAAPDKNDEGEPTSVRPGDDPEVADIIKQLESRRSEALPPISSAPTEHSQIENARPMTASDAEIAGASRSLVPEGTLFTDRRGRLVRIGDRLGIAFDGDANTPAEPAMYVIRSKALERLEGSIAHRNGTVDIIMTGRVYTYRNQNYILPLMAQVEPSGQLRPLQ